MEKQECEKKKNIRKWFVVVIIVLLLLLFSLYENYHLVVTNYTYQSSEITLELDGYKIVQISDLHNAYFGVNYKQLIKKIKAQNPDIIVITGDIVDSNHTNIKRGIQFAELAEEICPVYYVTGNHELWLDKMEQDALFDGLSAVGVDMLSDKTVDIMVDGEEDASCIHLVGLNDNSLIGTTLHDITVDLNGFNLLLAHEPQYLSQYSQENVDLILSGHAHGGQVRLPFVGGLVAPDQGFLPDYTEGKHVDGDTTMIISRGIGNSIIPIRIFNNPEIVCVELQSSN